MKQQGYVIEVNDNLARVVMQRHSSCGNCNACSSGERKNQLIVEAINNCNAKVGDKVNLDMESQDVLSAAFIIYIIPLAALLIGMFFGNMVLTHIGFERQKDIIVALIGFVSMAITFIGIRSREKGFKGNKKYHPIIVEIVDGSRDEA